MLNKMESDQQGFSLEEDILPWLLNEMLGNEDSVGPFVPQELHSKLTEIAHTKQIAFSYQNARAVCRRLATIRGILESRFGIRIVERNGGKGLRLRTIQRI